MQLTDTEALIYSLFVQYLLKMNKSLTYFLPDQVVAWKCQILWDKTFFTC